MKKDLTYLCTKCKGKCCKGPVFLTLKEYFRLAKINPRLKQIVSPQGTGFVIKRNLKCVFLGKKGCTIKNEQKPLDCLMFPLWFKLKNNKIQFMLTGACPFYKKIPSDWIAKTKKFALKKIKNWYDKDIDSYDNIIVKNYST